MNISAYKAKFRKIMKDLILNSVRYYYAYTYLANRQIIK